MPKTNPMVILIPSASATLYHAMTVGMPVRRVITTGTARPSAVPIRPPTPESTIVSTRNWTTIWDLRAPMARRIPISRVRSVTVASMMFMIPMPPTISEMPAMAPRTMLKRRLVASACRNRLSGTLICTSPRGWKRCTMASMAVAVASTCSKASTSTRSLCNSTNSIECEPEERSNTTSP